MHTKTQDIRIDAYDYPLPDERIAKYPLTQRDASKLLLYRGGEVGESRFYNLPDYLPKDSLLVFNNTKVIQARMVFHKETGARIEVFCLDPLQPRDYAQVFQQTEGCYWNCLVGNLKKWKEGALQLEVEGRNGETVHLKAERLKTMGDSHEVAFTWDNPDYTFADLLELCGELPIPPYLNRKTEESDLRTYQTVYSKVKGSVAAPTAGLHFTPEVLDALDARGFGREEVTLHVGAGTFKPVKSETIEGHAMHTEFIAVRRSSIERLIRHLGQIVAVGTTSVRTLESLYYIGILLSRNPDATMEELVVEQWMPYDEQNNRLTPVEALQQIVDYLDRRGADVLLTATRIIIAPGYSFKLVTGMITNFHQPKSTLILLVSAFVHGNWQKIYDYALSHDFRFLSYGDSSLLLPDTQ